MSFWSVFCLFGAPGIMAVQVGFGLSMKRIDCLTNLVHRNLIVIALNLARGTVAIFRCVQASLYEDLSIRWSVFWSVGPSKTHFSIWQNPLFSSICGQK